MRRQKLSFAGVVALAGVIAGCAKSDGGAAASAPPVVDHAAEERMILAADSGWMRHVVGKNVDSLMTYYAPDAVSYGFGAPASGTDAIRALYTEMTKATITDSKILSNTVRIADDGMMAYDHGTYSMIMTPPGGKPTPQMGAYLNVWKKVDGQWKLVAEMSSPLTPEKK